MNLKFLQSINESSPKTMGEDELESYLNLLYKKCNKSSKKEFNEQLKEYCGSDTIKECSKSMAEDTNYTDVLTSFEDISNKIDENFLGKLLHELVESGDES
jgi:phage gp16-like protein